jgi:hypothetical protein
MLANSRRSEFSKAKDRFFAPTEQFRSPPPNEYKPKTNLGQDVVSSLKKAPVPKFGHDTSDILEMHFQIKKAKENPSPG